MMLRTLFTRFHPPKTIVPCAHLHTINLLPNQPLTQVLTDDNMDTALDWLRDNSHEQEHTRDYSHNWAQHKVALQKRGFDFLGKRILSIGILPSLSTLSRMQKNTVQLYEQGASKRRVWKYWMLWLAWAFGSFCASGAGAVSTPDGGGDDRSSTAKYLLCLGNSSFCLANSFNAIYATSDMPWPNLNLPFWIVLPDLNPSGATYPTRIYSFPTSSSTLSIPPTVTCNNAAIATGTYSTTVTLAEGGQCNLTVSPQANSGSYSDVIYTGTLSRSGNIYYLTNGNVTGGVYSPPTAPSGLTATAVSATQINLSWTDNSSDETGFKIEQPAGTLITTTAANTTSYSHTGLTCNTTYNYSVKATNANGDSASATASATTNACPIPQTISGFTPASTVTYGDSPITLSATGGASGNAVTFASTTPSVCTVSGSTLTIVGAGTCTVTADQAGDATYSAATQVSKNITVGKKTITAQADNKSRAVGAANPAFTFSYTGLVGSDTISTPPSATTIATNSSPVGSYPITCTGGSDAKYTISNCADGTLTVTLATPNITLTPAAASVALGTAVTANFAVAGSPTPTGTVTVTDGVVSCNASVAAGTCNLTPTSAGVKTLTATYAGDSNYGTGTATASVGIAGVISSVTSLSLVEGATGTYTLKLATAPNSNVVITLTPNTQVTVSPTTLTFTTANWNTPQTVTVTAVNDTVYQGNRTVSTTQAITTPDTTQYLTTFSIPAFSVAITDNETPPYVPPAITYYNLSVKTTGTGKGTLGGTGAGSYAQGTSIALTATPDASSTFVAWTPTSCASTFNLSADTSCSAQFDLKPVVVVPPPVVTPILYNLTVSTSGTGKGTISGTSAGNYAAGTNVTLTATADSASTFVSWTPSSCGNAFSLNADTTCTAQFDLKPVVVTPPVVIPVTYKLTLSSSGTGKGTLSGTPAGTYPTGTSIALTATADANSTFTGWTPANCASFNLNGDSTCIAEFALKPSTTVGNVSIPPCVYNTSLAAATMCGGAGEKTTITRIDTDGQLSNTIIDAPLTSKGWISNSVVTAKGRITGGTITGYIENHGIISDIDFKGGSLIGGILGGNITNSSTVGGYFQNVTFMANASLKGGILQGTIRGNPNAPAVLSNLRIKAGTKLSGVILGDNVILEPNVTVETNVTLPNLEKTESTDAKGNSQTVKSDFQGGISVSGRPYAKQSQQKLAEPVIVRGRIIVAPEHIGQKVDLFVYSPYLIGTNLYGYYMADESSNILAWNQKVPELVAFKKGVILESVHEIDMFVGHFIATGSLNIVFGYRLSDGTVVMNTVPSTIEVTIQ